MLTIVFLSLLSVLFSETVILKDGRALHGEIVAKVVNTIYLQKEANLYSIEYGQIEKINNDGGQAVTSLIFKKKDFNKNDNDLSSAMILNIDGKKINTYKKSKQKTTITKINPGHLTAGAAFGIIAIDRFITVGDLSDAITRYEKMNMAYEKEVISELEGQRTRAILVGSLSAIASFVNFAYSFEKVEIKASPASLSLTYNF